MIYPYTKSPAEEKPSRENLFTPLAAGETACQFLTARPSAGKNDVIHCATGPAVRFGNCINPGNPGFFNIMKPAISDPETGLHRYKIFEVEADRHLPGEVRILNDPRLIGEILADEIRSAGGAKSFGVECPAFAWFLAGGYYRLLLHECDPHFNIDLAMKQLAHLPSQSPINFFAAIEGRISKPAVNIVPTIAERGFSGSAMGPGIPYEGMTGTLMQMIHHQAKPIYVAPFFPSLNGADPHSHSSLLDSWFKQIQKILAHLKLRLGGVDIAFFGGGMIPIPAWFQDWCKQEGIQIMMIKPAPDGKNQTNPEYSH